MKKKSVDERLKHAVSKFLKDEYDSNTLIKVIDEAVDPLGGLTGYSIKRDLKFSLHTKEDIYSIDFFDRNVRKVKNIEKKKDDFFNHFKNYMLDRNVPEVNLESHLGSSKKGGIENGSSKHYNNKPTQTHKYVNDHIVGEIKGAVTSGKIVKYLEQELQDCSLMDCISFEQDNKGVRVNFKEGMNHLNHALLEYSKTKGVKDLDLFYNNADFLKRDNEMLSCSVSEIRSKLKAMKKQVKNLEHKLKSKKKDARNVQYKYNSTNASLMDDFEWNRKRYEGIKDKQEQGYYSVQTKIMDSIFEKTAKEIGNIKVYTQDSLVITAKLDLERKKTLENENLIEELPWDVKYFLFEKWEDAKRIVTDYENALENIKPYVMNVKVQNTQQYKNMIFPIKSTLKSHVQEYFVSEFKSLERKFDSDNFYVNLNGEYLTLHVSKKLEDKEVYRTLNNITKYTGLVFKEINLDS